MLHRTLLAVAATLLLAAPAAAQTPTLSFHLAPQDSAVEGLAADCGTSFADPLNQSGRLVLRASSEVAEVMSDCTSEVANASFSRECELAMATSTVDYIVIVEADEDGEEWYFRASVLSPLRAATVWSDDVFASGTRRRATVDGCEELGSRFVAHLGFGEVQDVERRLDSEPAQSVLEVLDTTPNLVEVWIDGVHAGMSGGQLIVPAGDAQIELRATGYHTHGQPVTFSEGQVLTLRGIALPALPAQLVVVSNVVGAQVLVDDVVVGTTSIGGALEVDVPTTARVLRVTRDGYEDFDTSLSGLVPGQQRQFDVELRAAVPDEPLEDSAPPICGDESIQRPTGTFVGTTAGAGNDFTEYPSEDYAYKFTATAAGTVTASLCGGASWDTRLVAYRSTDSCPGERVAMNDDACGAQSEISFATVPGETYTVVVEGFSSGSGPYTLTLSSSSSPFTTDPSLCTNTCSTSYDNECDDGGPNSMYSICTLGTDCADCGPRSGNTTPDEIVKEPTPRFCGDESIRGPTGTFAGTTAGAGNDFTEYSSEDYAYGFTATAAGTVTASLCGGASWDTRLVAYRSTDSCPGERVAMNDDACGTQSEISFATVPGETYTVVVEAYTSGSGPYNLTFSSPPTTGSSLCTNTCSTSHDGECDDGGPNSLYSICTLGTDCADCGPRSGNTNRRRNSGLCTNTCRFANDGDCDDGGRNSDYSLCDLGTDCNDCGPR